MINISDLKARRVCYANNSWSEVDTSECVKSKLTDKLQTILDSNSDKSVTSHKLLELQHLEKSQSLGKEPQGPAAQGCICMISVEPPLTCGQKANKQMES